MSPRWALRSKSLVRYENHRCMYERYSPPSRGLVSITRAPRILPARCVKHHRRNRSRAIDPHCGHVADSVWAIPRNADPFQRQTLHHRSSRSARDGAFHTALLVCHHPVAGAANPTRRASGRAASLIAGGMCSATGMEPEASDGRG